MPNKEPPASSKDRYERSLTETVTASEQFVMAASGSIAMAAKGAPFGWQASVPWPSVIPVGVGRPRRIRRSGLRSTC